MAYINGKNILFSPQVTTHDARLKEIQITENGTYKASTDGADGYSRIVVNVAGDTSGGIAEASTEAEMTSLLSTAEVGSVVKYVGESTETYEKDTLYIVEAVSE